MRIDFFSLLWIVFIIMTLVPAINRRLVVMSRQRLMRAIEKKRGSRLITLIHR